MSDATLLFAGIGVLFAALGVGTAAVVSPLGTSTQVAKSLAQVEAMSGQLGLRTRDRGFGDRVLGPGMQRMVRLARYLSPSGVAGRIQRHLDLAGNPVNWPLERVFAVKGIGLLAGLAIGAFMGSGGIVSLVLWCGIAGAAGNLLPDVLTWNAGIKRQDRIQKTLPDALDMLTVSVEAGLGFDAALSQVTKNTDGPLSGEFSRVLQEMQIGKSRAAAFRSMTDRTSVTDLRSFVSAIVQADTLGVPIANVLREQAKEMRLKRQQRAEEKAHQIPVKILFPMLLFIFPALFVVIIGPAVISIIRSFS